MKELRRYEEAYIKSSC